MTVALGMVCEDGVLVASDSMGSNGLVAIQSVKVRAMQHLPVVWTAAGSQYVAEEVESALVGIDTIIQGGGVSSVWTKPDLKNVRINLKNPVHKAMRDSYNNSLVPTPPGRLNGNFASDFLFLGHCAGGSYFLEFAQDGQINWHMQEGFYAVGSGGAFASVAQAMFRHYLVQGPLPLELGRMLAYRIIEVVCAVSSANVSLPVQMAEVSGGSAHVLTDEELAEVSTGVERWRALEADTLRSGPAVDQDKVQRDLPSI